MGIKSILNSILSEPYIKNMRQSIVDGIEQVYSDATFDGNTNMEVIRARGLKSSIGERFDSVEGKIGDLGSTSTFKGSDTYANIINKTTQLVGDEWYDTTNSQSLRWNGMSWIPVGGTIKLGNKSITTEKYGEHTVTADKISEEVIKKQLSSNVFDKNQINATGYYQFDTGNLTLSGTYRSSGPIPVIPGETWVHLRPGHTTFWNENDVFISGVSGSNSNPFTVPANAKYVRITILLSEKDKEMLVKGNVFPATYVPYEESFLLGERVFLQTAESSISGLTWDALGDSLSSALGATKPYHAIIAEKYNLIVNNYGISGSRIAVAEGHDQPMCLRYTEMNSSADVITVFGGTNDYANNVPLGDINSYSTSTFYGALNVLCRGLIQKFPGKRIGFITPAARRSPDYAKMQLYVNAIKEVCAKYSIPVLDMWTGSGLWPTEDIINNTFFHNADGLHWNNLGHEVAARRIEHFIKSL